MNLEPFRDNPVKEVLEALSDERLMINILKNLNKEGKENLFEILEKRCSKEAECRWLNAYNKIRWY